MKSSRHVARRLSPAIVALLLFAAAAARAQSGGGYDLTHNVIAGGGATSLAGGGYTHGGTIGQPSAGRPSGSTYTLIGGFWAGPVLPAQTPIPPSPATTSPTATATLTPTKTPSKTPTVTPTNNVTVPPGSTPSTATATPPVSTPTRTPSKTVTASPSATSKKPTPTPTPTETAIPAMLSIDLSAADTTIPVDDISQFPDSGTIQIESELMTYTGKQALAAARAATAAAAAQPGMLLNVERGVNGTTPVPHREGAAVILLGAKNCPGDCDGSGDVTVNEVIVMVNIVLGTAEPSACPGIPSGKDVDVTLIVQAVGNALGGCPVA